MALAWNMINFIQKWQFCIFSKFLHKVWFFFRYLSKSVARECVTMVTNHRFTLKKNDINTKKKMGWAFQ